jgi:endonuclease/exonuclease/phosphatase (EEP) superfamily protein YafD
VHQPLWLARELSRRDPQGQGYDLRYFPTNESLQGLAVLSKIEIVFDEGDLLTSVGQQTGLQRVQLRPDEGILTVYNTWLGLLVEGDIAAQEQDQQRQLSEAFTLIRAAHPDGNLGRMILGGTFNNVPDSDLIRRMSAETPFADPFAGEPLATSATLVRAGQRARYDYLWTNLLALGKNVIDSSASDHRPAVVEVRVAR